MEDTQTINDVKKCVLIIDNTQPVGIIANTASVLSITLGRNINSIFGKHIYDKRGGEHLGITQMPIPILGTSSEKIKEIRQQLVSLDLENLMIVGFTNIAQKSKTYDHYEATMLTTDENDICYIGIAIYGDKKVINKATGNLSLIR